MKRWIILFLVAMVLLGSALGCSGEQTAEADVFDDVPLTTILEDIYRAADLTLPSRGTTVITSKNAAYYLGTEAVSFSEAVASDALLDVVPFSLCLLRIEDKAEAETIALAIAESANPHKWGSVGLSDDKVITDYAGDVIILIMAEEAEALHAAFLRLSTGEKEAGLQTP